MDQSLIGQQLSQYIDAVDLDTMSTRARCHASDSQPPTPGRSHADGKIVRHRNCHSKSCDCTFCDARCGGLAGAGGMSQDYFRIEGANPHNEKVNMVQAGSPIPGN